MNNKVAIYCLIVILINIDYINSMDWLKVTLSLPNTEILPFIQKNGFTTKVNPTFIKQWQAWHEEKHDEKLQKNNQLKWARMQHEKHRSYLTAQPFYKLQRRYIQDLRLLRKVYKSCNWYKKKYEYLLTFSGITSCILYCCEYFSSKSILPINGLLLYKINQEKKKVEKTINEIKKPLKTLEKIHEETKRYIKLTKHNGNISHNQKKPIRRTRSYSF